MYNLSVECRFIGAANIGRATIFLLILIELDNLWIWTAQCRHLMTFNQNTKLHIKTLASSIAIAKIYTTISSLLGFPKGHLSSFFMGAANKGTATQ